MRADIESLTQRAREEVETSPLRDLLHDILIEEEWFPEGDSFLRVSLRMKPVEAPPLDDYMTVMKRVEDALLELDDRTPSVRFPDAA